jgi:hypothetical protein
MQWYADNDAPKRIIDNFYFRVEATIEQIMEYPQLYSRRKHGARHAPLIKFPYSIVYLDKPEMIYIVAVAHNQRKPGYWKHRISQS